MSKRSVVVALLAAAIVAAMAIVVTLNRGAARDRFLMAYPDSIPADAALLAYAMARGPSAFAEHCAACHGTQLQGDAARGVPILRDADWLYGSGRVTELERTILYGIRSGHPKTWNLAAMPAFATANPYQVYKIEPLQPRDIDDVTQFVLAFQHHASDAESVKRGSVIYHNRGLCFDCHGEDSRGDPAIGAPDLTDDIWLYGDGSEASVSHDIAHGLEGFCPTWADRLPAETIRSLAVYINRYPEVAAHER